MLLEVEYGHFPAGENIADTHRHAKSNHSPATSHRHHIFRLPPQQDRHLTPPHPLRHKISRMTRPLQKTKPGPWFRLNSPNSSSRLPFPRSVPPRVVRLRCTPLQLSGTQGCVCLSSGNPTWRGMAGLRALEIPPGGQSRISLSLFAASSHGWDCKRGSYASFLDPTGGRY